MIIEEIFVGPLDILTLVSYLSMWGLVGTFITLVQQFKACVYEIEKAAATYPISQYPYSTWYKKEAL